MFKILHSIMSKNWKTYAVKKGKESTSHSKHRAETEQYFVQ